MGDKKELLDISAFEMFGSTLSVLEGTIVSSNNNEGSQFSLLQILEGTIPFCTSKKAKVELKEMFLSQYSLLSRVLRSVTHTYKENYGSETVDKSVGGNALLRQCIKTSREAILGYCRCLDINNDV